MTPEQRNKVNLLRRCRFLPGSFDKRFVRDMSTKSDDYELSKKQATYLDKTFTRYRKQIAVITDREFADEHQKRLL